jgi:hypothetical protein
MSTRFLSVLRQGAISAYTYTFQASPALFGIYEYGVPVPRQINFPQHLIGTGTEAFPAGFAFVRAQLNKTGPGMTGPAMD